MKGGQMPDSMLTALSDRPPDLKICHFLIKIHLRPDRQKGQTMKIINNSHKKQQNIKKVELYKISFKNRRTPPPDRRSFSPKTAQNRATAGLFASGACILCLIVEFCAHFLGAPFAPAHLILDPPARICITSTLFHQQ